MSSHSRRPSINFPSSSSSVKRPASENAAKIVAKPTQQPKKRPALSNLTNQTNSARNASRPAGRQVITASATNKLKNASSLRVANTGLQQNSLHVPSTVKELATFSYETTSLLKHVETPVSFDPFLQPCNTILSPNNSDGASVSMDETISSCDSLKSPDIEYIDNCDASVVSSLERRTCNNLHISKDANSREGDKWKRDILMAVETESKIVNVDNNHGDPQSCAAFACDIYKHLREAEIKKKPSTDFMERIQKDINASMRAILVDWLVEVAEEYRLVPDTLYLTVNYIDRYLSVNAINKQRLQLLGVACMMIAAKYEEICAPQVEEFCYITDNTYFRDEVLQMEAAVLRYLKFEMTAPTAKCFLRRFVRAAQASNEVPMLQLEFLAGFLAELSLLEYNMLCYSPSLIAASAIFLAKFVLQTSKIPWNATLGHYTSYKPIELRECVMALHGLFSNSHGSSLSAIREKYSQHKYKFVAKQICPPTIPTEFFQDS